jgi:PIN domain nuclease of toxin-antitoxin system
MSSPSAAPLLLDTHYWIWLQAGTLQAFTKLAREAIDRATEAGSLMISVISLWELGMLEAKGRVRLRLPCTEWVDRALGAPGLTLAPLTAQIAIESTRLPGSFHGDPADRIIIATARMMDARLLTRDRKIAEYARNGHVAVL